MADQNAAVTLLREQFKWAQGFLMGTIHDVTPEQSQWLPPGKVNPLGANYGHIITGLDGGVNGLIRGAAPLMVSTWEGKTGFSEPAPPPGAWGAWARRVKVDMPAAQAYAQAVFAANDEYLATLSDADLARQVDLSAIGAPPSTVAEFLTVLLGNICWHTGEISCLKGLQDAKGYPV